MRPIVRSVKRRAVRFLTGLTVATFATALMAPGPIAHAAQFGHGPHATNGNPIVVIVMENHDLSEVQNEPYLSSFAAGGTLFTNYFAITHPSLPNYIAMTSGSTGPFTSDAGSPGSDHDANVFDQLDAAHSQSAGWLVYAESMSVNCQYQNDKPYVRHHNPPPYYADINGPQGSCATNDVPLPTHASVAPPLAPLTFVIPNNCDNMHGTSSTGACPGNTQAIIDAGDAWLSDHVPAYLAAGATVVITFDEGNDDNPSSTNNVYTAIEGPGVAAGQVDAGHYDHYSLLAGLETHFGLPLLANAGSATPLPLG